MTDIGCKIRELRKTHGNMSQTELGFKINCTKQTISNYERGERKVDYTVLEAIADIFNVPMSFFLTDEEQKEELRRIYETYQVSDIYGEHIRSVLSAKQLAEEEAELLECFRACDEPGRDFILTTARHECRRYLNTDTHKP